MTKEDYVQARDQFAGVARAVDDLTELFIPEDCGMRADEGIEEFLDRCGFYMTSREYREVLRAKEIFETLAGRNAVGAL